MIGSSEPMDSTMVIEDVREAILALSGNRFMREEGIDEAFAEMFARNCANYENLSDSTKEKIKSQYLEMAGALSYLEGVAKKHSEEKSKELARWFKNVNLLLAMNRVGTS